MSNSLAPHDFVYIEDGDHKGSWGIVALVDSDGVHVRHANGGPPLLFDRDQLRKPRTRPDWAPRPE